MRRTVKRVEVCVVVAIACIAASCGRKSPTSPSGPSPADRTFLSCTSSPGDYIGQGLSRRFDPADTTFVGQMLDGNRRLELAMVVGAETCFLDVGAGPGQQLRQGTYVNAPSGATTGPFLQFSGADRGCSVGVSDFEILEAGYAAPPPGSSPLVSGIVERFRARFTQRCNGPASPPLNGEVSLRALVHNRCATPSGFCQ